MAKAKTTDGLCIQIASDELLKALTRVKGVIEKDAASPVLSCVRIATEKDSEGGRLAISAYDLEIGLISRHPCEVSRAGEIAVPAKLLRQLVEVAPENIVMLEALANNRVRFNSGQMECEIAGMNPEEVTSVSVPESMRFSPCDTSVLLELINGVRLAVSHDQTRINLCGALLERTRTGWLMVATDGHRLAVIDRKIEEGNARAVEGSVFLTEKTLLVLRSILGEDDAATGQLGFNKSVAAFRRHGLDIVARLGEGQFPDWREVVPEECNHVVNVARSQLIHSAERMAPICGGSGAVVVHVGKNVIKLQAKNPDRGFVTDRMIVEHVGADVTLGLHGGQLADALHSLHSDSVALGVEDSLSPVVIKPIGEDKTSAWVIMPMRVEVADMEEAEGLDTVFEPMRQVFRAQNAKKSAVDVVCKIGRDAARAARREAGKPLVRGESNWPPSGFWSKREVELAREIPEDEREICRSIYWAEAVKPMAVKDEVEEPEIPAEEMGARLKEMELIGQQAGTKVKAANGNRLAVYIEWPKAGYWLGLEKQLGRTLSEPEREACQVAYHAVATGGKKPE